MFHVIMNMSVSHVLYHLLT